MKRTVTFFLILALSLITTTSALATNSFVAAPAKDDVQESDKLYMNGGVEPQEKVKVISEKPSDLKPADTKILSGAFPFESSLYSENPDNIYSQLQTEITDDRNSTFVKTIIVDPVILSFLTDFTNKLTNTYVTKKKPNLSSYYDLSIDARRENIFLVQNSIYYWAIIKPNDVLSFTNEIQIQDIESLDKGVQLVKFYMITKLVTSDGNEEFGNTNYAYLIPVKDGYRLLKYWCQNTEFANLQKQFQKKVTPSDARSDSDLFSTQMLNDYVTNKAAVLTKEAIQDKDIAAELAAPTSIAATAYTTISYDRKAVAAAAKKYAYNYNPLFVAMSADCTNYVSQCIWQSPSWKFDKIGNSTSVMWSCTKLTSGVNAGKYYRDPPTWAGVTELFYYFRNNDNASVAGTVYGISATTTGYTIANIQLGDVIQFCYDDGTFGHSTIVTEVPTSGTKTLANVKVAAHTDDYSARPVSEYLVPYGEIWYNYRVIHINNYIVGTASSSGLVGTEM